MTTVVVREEPLRGLVDGVCRAMGAPPEVAAEVAVHLVRANLSGHDAEGVGRLPEYVAECDAGALVPSAAAHVLRETAVTALIDAGRGFGQHSTAVALAWCLERARENGLAAAAVRRSSHVGRLSEYGERAAEAGLLAIVTTGAAGPGVGETMLFGGRDRFFGANPWTFAAPGVTRSLVLDARTSTASEADVRLARARGDPLPPDCICDRFGRPSTDPEDFLAGGALVPLGGALAGQWGSGLAFASALFGGLAAIGEEDHAGAGGRIAGVLVQALDPAAFGDPGAYRELVEGTLAAAKAARPAPGRSEVLLPGELEARARTERSRAGIRLSEVTWAALAAVAGRFGVPMPE